MLVTKGSVLLELISLFFSSFFFLRFLVGIAYCHAGGTTVEQRAPLTVLSIAKAHSSGLCGVLASHIGCTKGLGHTPTPLHITTWLSHVVG